MPAASHITSMCPIRGRSAWLVCGCGGAACSGGHWIMWRCASCVLQCKQLSAAMSNSSLIPREIYTLEFLLSLKSNWSASSQRAVECGPGPQFYSGAPSVRTTIPRESSLDMIALFKRFGSVARSRFLACVQRGSCSKDFLNVRAWPVFPCTMTCVPCRMVNVMEFHEVKNASFAISGDGEHRKAGGEDVDRILGDALAACFRL